VGLINAQLIGVIWGSCIHKLALPPGSRESKGLSSQASCDAMASRTSCNVEASRACCHTVASQSDPADVASHMRGCDMEQRFLIGVMGTVGVGEPGADIGRAYTTIVAVKDFCVARPCSHHQC
jgi:hypothetical protein